MRAGIRGLRATVAIMKNKSDVAIIMLNYYPAPIVMRAVGSIVRQRFAGSWHLYLGFHDRNATHRREIQAALHGLPVHYLEIDGDMVFDSRPRDRILQEALRTGDHRYLFFLDDDDEWYPGYLEAMTRDNAPFICCAKDVKDDGTGEIRTVADDCDYESMGFHFHLWKGRHLPYFVKQVSDKWIYRDFRSSFPNHSFISEPLYVVHRHAGSLTFQKTLDRSARSAAVAKNPPLVVLPPAGVEGPAASLAQDCAEVARALQVKPVPIEQLEMCLRVDPAEHPRMVLACEEVLQTADPIAPPWRDRAVIMAIVEDSPETLFHMPTPQRDRRIEMLTRADALVLADPAWVEVYEGLNPRCIPVGIPSSCLESSIKAHTRSFAAGDRWRLAILQRSRVPAGVVEAVLRRLPPCVEVTDALEECDVCWWPDTANHSWGRSILRAFEFGVPCVTTSRTSAAKILYGGSGFLEDRRDAALVARRIQDAAGMGMEDTLREALPLFRRCFSAFYWLNAFTAYVARALPQLGILGNTR